MRSRLEVTTEARSENVELESVMLAKLQQQQQHNPPPKKKTFSEETFLSCLPLPRNFLSSHLCSSVYQMRAKLSHFPTQAFLTDSSLSSSLI